MEPTTIDPRLVVNAKYISNIENAWTGGPLVDSSLESPVICGVLVATGASDAPPSVQMSDDRMGGTLSLGVYTRSSSY